MHSSACRSLTRCGRATFWICHSSSRRIGLAIHCQDRLLLVFHSHQGACVVDVTRPMRAPTLSYLERTLLWISTRVTQQAQPSAGLPVRVRKAHHLWPVANYMVAAHDEVGHSDVRILDEFRKR